MLTKKIPVHIKEKIKNAVLKYGDEDFGGFLFHLFCTMKLEEINRISLDRLMWIGKGLQVDKYIPLIDKYIPLIVEMKLVELIYVIYFYCQGDHGDKVLEATKEQFDDIVKNGKFFDFEIGDYRKFLSTNYFVFYRGTSYLEEILKDIEIANKVYTMIDYHVWAIESMIIRNRKEVYLPLGLCGEAGEVSDKIKKVYRDKDGDFSEKDKEEIVKELGDVLWYVAALSDLFGYTLNDVARKNIEKIEKRKKNGTMSGSGDNR